MIAGSRRMLYIIKKQKRKKGKDAMGNLEPMFLAAACCSDQRQRKETEKKK